MHIRWWLLALAIAGCGANDDSDEATDETEAWLCEYTFELAVRSGPSAGLAVSGPLTLVMQADGTYAGGLHDDATAKYFAVAGEAGGTLRFTTPDGKTIVGKGPALGDFARECPGALDGDLTGPERGDAGDWLARTGVQAISDIARAVCDSCKLYNTPGRPGICGTCSVCAFECGNTSAVLQADYSVEVDPGPE
jgi:hypothetical protein